MDALTLLLDRRSHTGLAAPGPDAAQLDTILRAALRVPDFQSLRPYEFLVAEGEGRDRLGALLRQAAQAADATAETVERAARMPLRAPLVVVVVARARPSQIVHVLEQRLTAGCAVMAMQMAAIALGFGGIWRSGWPMFNRPLHDLLGLAGDDQIVGFLYLGTPTKAPTPLGTPAQPADFVRRL